VVQTGFKAQEHCWKCFKENKEIGFIDEKPINLCKGCLYVVKQMSQWLNAYGLGIRQIMDEGGNFVFDNVKVDNVRGGIEGVEGGGRT